MSAGEIPVALLAGFLSFLAPCVLPLVPGYLSAVSAVNADELGRLQDQIDAQNLWELDRHVETAMDALRVPPGDADGGNLEQRLLEHRVPGGDRELVGVAGVLRARAVPPAVVETARTRCRDGCR